MTARTIPVFSAKDYRRAIRHLRSGVASPLAARIITVGTDSVEEELRKRESHWLKSRGSSPNMCFILGDWGFGKSHLRMLCVDSFLTRNLPFIHDHIDGKAGSLAHLHRSVPRWLESLQMGPHVGLRSILESGSEIDIRNWCLARRSNFSFDLLHGINGNEWAWSLATGHQYQFPDYSYHHSKAFEILIESAGLFSALGRGGIVLLLDEAENVSRQYDIRGRRKSYDTLGRLSRQHSLFNVVFVTDRFLEQVEADRERGGWNGWANWTDEAHRFVTTLNSIPALRPPTLDLNLAKALLEKVVAIYLIAFGGSAPPNFNKWILDAWQRTTTRSVRLLVRLAIDALDRRTD